MSQNKLPITGEALAYAAKGYIDQAYEEVREALEWTHLPRALLAIWEYSPMLKAERKKFPQPIGPIREICHVIVTFPGSIAVERIRDIIISSKLVPNAEGEYKRAQEIASEVFTLTMRYTRVQNLSRHIRTAVNSHLRMLHIESSRERPSSAPEDFMPSLPHDSRGLERVAMLRSVKISSDADVNDWADDVNTLLANYSTGVSDDTTGSLVEASLKRVLRRRGAVAPGALTSYKLRFKQALAATLDIDLAMRNIRIEKTSNKSIVDLLRELDNMPSEFADLYQMLENLRPIRITRPNTTGNEFVHEKKMMGAENPKKNLLKHVLSLDGREFMIEGSRDAFTPDMVNGVMKTVGIQLSIDPDARELSAAFENRGQVLRVQIERPKKSDHKKLAEIFQHLI